MDPVCCAFPMTLKTLLNILYTTVLNHAHANKAEEGRAKRKRHCYQHFCLSAGLCVMIRTTWTS